MVEDGRRRVDTAANLGGVFFIYVCAPLRALGVGLFFCCQMETAAMYRAKCVRKCVVSWNTKQPIVGCVMPPGFLCFLHVKIGLN